MLVATSYNVHTREYNKTPRYPESHHSQLVHSYQQQVPSIHPRMYSELFPRSYM